MARTIDTIFNDMVARKNENTALQSLTSSSSTAIWRLIFYVVAFAVYVHETLWDTYKKEVDSTIDNMIPHRPKWYRDKTLAFMKDKTLIADTDRYDTTGMGEDEILAAKVIKHATANENATSSLLVIKVAGEDSTTGARQPISSSELTQLEAYIAEIKDAGVRTTIINQDADEFRCEIEIHYEATKDPSTVQYDVENAIKDYVENLPFNGEYSNMALIDHIQEVDGVKIAELKNSESAPASTNTYVQIQSYVIPDAGYFHVNETTIRMIAYTI